MKNKVLRILLSAVIACALWVYVITVERTETEQMFYNVPVVIDGESVLEDRGMKITSDTDLTVTLRLSGKRSVLNNLRSSDITVLADMTRITEAGKKELNYSVSFPGDVQDSSIEVVSKDPASIAVTVAQWETKEIPIQTELPGTLPESYIIDHQNIQLDSGAVTIAGPKDVVDQIAMAKLVVDMDGRTESVEERVNVTLCGSDGTPVTDVSSVTPDPYRVLVKVPVLMVRDIGLRLPVTEGGGLTAEDVQVTMEYDTITVSGSPAVVSKLEDTLTLGTIDLSQENESFTDREYPVKLPEGVRNISGFEAVKVSLTLPPMKVKEFQVPLKQFEFTGLPEGMKHQVRTQSLDVWIRGRETILDKVEPTDIRVIVDLSSATQTGYYPATVVVDNISEVGVVPDPSSPNDPYEVYVAIEALLPVVPEG